MVFLSQVQLVSGSACLFLEEVDTNKLYVLQTWLLGIQRYLSYTKATVTIPKAWLPTLQQDNNVMIMDIFEMAKPGTTTLDHLNRVRLYLGVTTLADLCNDKGKMILSCTLTGYARFRPATPWPNQIKPTKYSW
eukprot:15342744-Ditylum_brightwellii.AAC.1